jgi:hypothetical protein
MAQGVSRQRMPQESESLSPVSIVADCRHELVESTNDDTRRGRRILSVSCGSFSL